MNIIEDYHNLRIPRSELRIIIIKNLILITLMVYIFYQSIYGFILLIPLSFIQIKSHIRSYQKSRMTQLNKDFKELMETVSNGLSTGYSIENAFLSAKQEYEVLNPNSHSDIYQELIQIKRKLEMNIAIETILMDFAHRSHLEDVEYFAHIITIAKRNGGNIIQVIHRTVSQIADKNQVNEEIETMVAAKRLEQKIMGYMPMAIIFYLKLTNGSYLTPLYGNILGIVVVSIGIMITQAATYWANKIIEIEV